MREPGDSVLVNIKKPIDRLLRPIVRKEFDFKQTEVFEIDDKTCKRVGSELVA